MKVELTKEEAAAYMAYQAQRQSAVAQIQLAHRNIADLQTANNRAVDALHDLAERIRQRVDEIPDVPLERWIPSIDPIALTGSMEVPEAEE